MQFCGGLVCRTPPRRFAWKQTYSQLLPSHSMVPSAYICGRLRQAHHYSGRFACSAASVVVESPSDGAGILTFTANTVDGAARALSEIMHEAQALSHSVELRALERLEAILRQNADLLASAEALATGICLREARNSIGLAANVVGSCAERLRGCPASVAASETIDVEDLLRSLGCSDRGINCHGIRCATGGGSSVALCYTSANYPLQRGVEAIAAALLRGHVVVWLPSLEAPLSALWLMQLLCRSFSCQADENDSRSATSDDKGCDPGVGMHTVDPINIILYRGENSILLEKAFGVRGAREGLELVGLTNGFTEGQTNQFSVHLSDSQVRRSDISALYAIDWHHRLTKPAVAIVSVSQGESQSFSPSIPLTACAAVAKTDSAPTHVECVAENFFHHAFHCNGRTLHPLHVAFIPHEDVLPILRYLRERIRQVRIGHSLDSSVELGPLPTSKHLSLVKELIESATSGDDDAGVCIQQVCGGFEVAMPAGFFCLPCVLYARLPNEAPGAVSSMVERVMKLRTELDELGGGPVALVCAYDLRHQLDELHVWKDNAQHYVVHDW
ncbi:aldehyde dehydrogenase family, putative [Trypanosoma equiperdum]|uniref:Aldehyde dehydrogenase family, putative n=1 Tax=Trypanosoma equiperdum TaxID=5694 RepID=A0A1G4IBS2_TRYEQ|nr:aldehyde dehydrogenase family, putative [Trypanosoma equiperdum]